jgi:hypothetical protein
MKNNGFINAMFNEFLQILDARTQISVFEIEENGTEKLRFSNVPVYELLTMEKKIFRHYEVVGIVAGLTTNILIRKES